MQRFYFLLVCCLCTIAASAQTNMRFTNPEIYNVLKGDYDPSTYLPAEIIDDPYDISGGLLEHINPDSLKATLFELRKFENRNTGSDTISPIRGMGAARSW